MTLTPTMSINHHPRTLKTQTEDLHLSPKIIPSISPYRNTNNKNVTNSNNLNLHTFNQNRETIIENNAHSNSHASQEFSDPISLHSTQPLSPIGRHQFENIQHTNTQMTDKDFKISPARLMQKMGSKLKINEIKSFFEVIFFFVFCKVYVTFQGRYHKIVFTKLNFELCVLIICT